jgi:hypothetical protein
MLQTRGQKYAQTDINGRRKEAGEVIKSDTADLNRSSVVGNPYGSASPHRQRIHAPAASEGPRRCARQQRRQHLRLQVWDDSLQRRLHLTRIHTAAAAAILATTSSRRSSGGGGHTAGPPPARELFTAAAADADEQHRGGGGVATLILRPQRHDSEGLRRGREGGEARARGRAALWSLGAPREPTHMSADASGRRP